MGLENECVLYFPTPTSFIKEATITDTTMGLLQKDNLPFCFSSQRRTPFRVTHIMSAMIEESPFDSLHFQSIRGVTYVP